MVSLPICVVSTRGKYFVWYPPGEVFCVVSARVEVFCMVSTREEYFVWYPLGGSILCDIHQGLSEISGDVRPGLL